MDLQATSGTSDSLPKIILFGDSLTEWSFEDWNNGFGYELEQRYEGRAEVLNRGKAGYTSELLKPYFASILKEVRWSRVAPLFLTIFLGANDACFRSTKSWTPLVPLDQYEANLRDFIDAFLTEPASGDAKVILITPPPINVRRPEAADYEGLAPAAKKAFIETNAEEGVGQRTYRNKKLYADKVMALADEYARADTSGRVVALNFWKAVTDFALQKEEGTDAEAAYAEGRLPGSGHPDANEFTTDIFTDRLHLGATGYEILTKELFKLLDERFPEI